MILLAGSSALALTQLVSMWLLARKSAAGWLVAILAQGAWVPYDVITRQYGFIALSFVSVPVYIRGWRNFHSEPDHQGEEMTENAIFTTLYNAQLPNTLTTLYTSAGTDGNVVQRLIAFNADSSAHTVTLTAVRKGGSATDAYATPICAALSIPATSAADLLANEQLQSALDELQLSPGDYLYGEASAASEVTLLVLGE